MLLWYRIRRKQLCDVQFYRQKPIANYIVDFYAPTIKLVIEVDGGQHFENKHLEYDSKRDNHLLTLGLNVLRFDNLQVLTSIDNVLEAIYHEIQAAKKIPPNPPFSKGGT
jgi:very-short-patch-repair endonuclease